MRSVLFSQAEANALLIRNIGSTSEFEAMLQEAAKQGRTERVIEVAKILALLNSAQVKLMEAGATTDWLL